MDRGSGSTVDEVLIYSLPFHISCVVFHIPLGCFFRMLRYLAVEVEEAPPFFGVSVTFASPRP